VASVDVVVVSYNSRKTLRSCIEPLAAVAGVQAIVVDNASVDGSLETLADLDVMTIARQNDGFAAGCNAGWRRGSSPYVLFLNPDARIDTASLDRLAEVLERNGGVAVAAPRIVEADGALDFSQRRFPRLRSTYAHALFLNRVFPRATWASELVQDPASYDRQESPDWASGACLLVRRTVLEEVGGWDERFFMYCEDKDLCKRIRDAGHDIRYTPDAVVEHVGGVSAPRSALMPVLAASRVRYARKHSNRAVAALERIGIALTGLTHAVVSRGGWAVRAGHAASAATAAGRSPRIARRA
jgi:N-acetylglucosaminyl-diphospho-decaprenol L-rhamnosyltransferase